jgi:O-antigen ligase
MTAIAFTKRFDRENLERLADGLAAAVAVSLPWSTSATGILVVLWLIAFFPTLDLNALRREVAKAPGFFPLLLVGLGVLGMAWADADVSLAARLNGVASFLKLACIPLLFVQFHRSDRGIWVLAGFLVSCTALLAASVLSTFTHNIWGLAKDAGIPVKDRIAQSAEFTICAFGTLYVAQAAFRERRQGTGFVFLLLTIFFIGNIVFIITSRTALFTLPVLIVLYTLTQFKWRGSLIVLAGAAVLISGVWASSPIISDRLEKLVRDAQAYRATKTGTSAGQRLEFWKKSLDITTQSPIIGHGTGSIREQFRRAATGEGLSALVAANPHNQTFAVAIQLGLLGVGALWAMWIAHLFVFRGGGLAAWIGMLIVVQNIVGSLFNSHLFDFTHGWIYVFGVGVTGGMVMAQANGRSLFLPKMGASQPS